MKKLFIYFTASIAFVFCFAACSSQSGLPKQDSPTNTSSVFEKTESKDKVSKNTESATSQAKTPIEDAEISAFDAIEKIKAFSMEKLGLDGKKEDYKFMVSTKGLTIDKTDYLEVVASVVAKENEDGSISMDTKGDYFVSYDGSKILIRDVKTGEFSALK